MPTFIIFKEGTEVDRLEGANEAKIREKIKKYI
jgi:thioredoxin-like negative regulator of GroEL